MPAFPSAVVVVLQLTLAPAAAPRPLPADTSPPAASRAAVAATETGAPPQGVAAPGPRLELRFDLPRAWALEAMPADTPQPRPRPRAIMHSDAYYTRLALHRYASYAILPLFAGEWIVGQKLANEEPQRSLKGLHGVLGAGIFAAFGLNTITGAWNLWDARHDPGAARRTTHVLLMLAADAGFAATWATVPHGQRIPGFGRTGPTLSAMNRHRDIAIGSIALGTIGTGIMWLWK